MPQWRVGFLHEKCFGRIDIANPNDNLAVHDVVFYRHSTLSRRDKMVARKLVAQRFHTEVFQQPVLFDRVLCVVEAAKPPRVVVAQPRPILFQYPSGRAGEGFIRRHYSQAARHTQMRNQRACVGFNQKILCASADALNNATRKMIG